MPISVRQSSNDPYGEGFWSDRLRFLDYSGSDFASVQERHLRAQLQELGSIPVIGELYGGVLPRSVAELMRDVPLSVADDYAPRIEQLRVSARGQNCTWVHGDADGQYPAWAPYTLRGLQTLSDSVMSALGVAADASGNLQAIRPGANVMYRVPPRPHVAGIIAFELARRFGLGRVAEGDAGDGQEVSDRLDREESGTVDALIFADDPFATDALHVSNPDKESGDLPKPVTILNLGSGTRSARKQPAAIPGRSPFDVLISPEAGAIGMQYGSGPGLALDPEACFREFLPESEIKALRSDPGYNPRTALLPDVTTDGLYEVVVTSFYGMPYLRYRTGRLVRFSAGQLGYGPDLEPVGMIDQLSDAGDHRAA